jgi:hypothetical protein
MNIADAVFAFSKSGIHIYQDRGVLCATGTLVISERDTVRRHKQAFIAWLLHESVTLRHSALGLDIMRKLLQAYRAEQVSELDYLRVSRAVDRSFERQEPEKIRRYCVDALRLFVPGSDILTRFDA